MLDPYDNRALNAAVSGLKVSLHHMQRLERNGILEAGPVAALTSVVAEVEGVREAIRLAQEEQRNGGGE